MGNLSELRIAETNINVIPSVGKFLEIFLRPRNFPPIQI